SSACLPVCFPVSLMFLFFSLLLPPPMRSTLFPYTTLFRSKDIIDSQKTGTRKTRKDAVLVNELLVTSDRDFFERLDPGEQKRFFEESYKLFSERYGKQNIAYATVHNDEQTPHMHL